MRTLVVGLGGVGGVLAARLAQAGVPVVGAARGDHGQAVKAHGLTVRGKGGDSHAALSVAEVATLADRSFDLVLLCVKWPELLQALDEVPRILAPNGVVVPLLNGLDSEDVVARYVGAQRTIAGVAYMSAGIVAPGIVYEHGQTRLGFAAYRPGQEAEIGALVRLFTDAKVGVQAHDDARAMLWAKMVWNAPFNAICALANLTAGEVVQRSAALVKNAMREVIAVARAEGVLLPDLLIDGMLHVTRTEFPDTEPSMLQDMRKGRPTEIDILAGRVIALAAERNVAVPVLDTLTALVHLRTT